MRHPRRTLTAEAGRRGRGGRSILSAGRPRRSTALSFDRPCAAAPSSAGRDAAGRGIRTARSGATASSNPSTPCNGYPQANSASHCRPSSAAHGLCSSSANARARDPAPIAIRVGRMKRRPRTPYHQPKTRTLPSSKTTRSSSKPGTDESATFGCPSGRPTHARFLAEYARARAATPQRHAAIPDRPRRSPIAPTIALTDASDRQAQRRGAALRGAAYRTWASEDVCLGESFSPQHIAAANG